MHELTHRRRGWCPNVWAPMPSGDGLLVRVQTAATRLTCSQVRALAALARAHGNGVIELTRRANLQLRGLNSASLPGAQEALVRLGLADGSPVREARRALLVNPLAGLDAACTPLSPLAEQLDDALRAADALTVLAPKFSVLLDGGGEALAGVSADVEVDLSAAAPAYASLYVAGEHGTLALGACRRSDVLPAVLCLIDALAAWVGDERRRMRDWVRACGVDTVRGALGAWLIEEAHVRAARGDSPLALGLHDGPRPWLVLALPFGSAEAPTWEALAELADRHGVGELRVAPGRRVVLPGLEAGALGRAIVDARALGLLVGERDPALRVIACAGAPACAQAWGETRAMARALGALVRPLLERGASLHVSGCSKGCASRDAAAVTVVQAEGGARLGFDVDVAQAAVLPVCSHEAVRERLVAFAGSSTSTSTSTSTIGRGAG